MPKAGTKLGVCHRSTTSFKRLEMQALLSPIVRGVLCHLSRMHKGKGNTGRSRGPQQPPSLESTTHGAPMQREAIYRRGFSGCVSIKMIVISLNEKLILDQSVILIQMDTLPLGRPSHRRSCGQEAEERPVRPAAGPVPGDEHRLASVARRCSTAALCAVKGCSRVRSSTSGRCGTNAGSHSSTRSVSTVIAWSQASFTSSHPPSISSMTTMAMVFFLLRRRWSRPRENAGARNGATRRQWPPLHRLPPARPLSGEPQ
jgi:hypothetical protein